MDRQALTSAIAASRAKVEAALQGLTTEQMVGPGAAGEWSVKDILAHITACEVAVLTNLGKAERGQRLGQARLDRAARDAQDAKWLAEYRDRPLERVLDDFRGVHRQIIRKVMGLSEEELAAPVRWQRGLPLHQYFMEEVVDHEAEHLPDLQAWRQKQRHGANGAS